MHVPAALWKCWDPNNWCTNGLCQVTPRYFLTRLVPPSRSRRSSTWCRRGWYFVQRGSTLSSPFFPLLPLLFFPRRFCSSGPHCRSSLRAHLSLRHIWADYSWTSRWARFSIYTSTSTTWTMARRVDARRRWVELPTQVVLRLLFRRVWLRRRRQAQLPTCQRDVH